MKTGNANASNLKSPPPCAGDFYVDLDVFGVGISCFYWMPDQVGHDRRDMVGDDVQHNCHIRA